MAATAETQPLNLNRLKFYHGDPQAFAQCLPEMRRLRAEHYQRNEGFLDRTPEQISRFAHSLTPESWFDPAKTRGSRPGQRYKNLTIVAAFDTETDALQGFGYAGINVNSRIEQRYAGSKLLRYPAMAFGALERYVKLKRKPEDYSYVWLREIIRSPDQSSKLEPLLGAMAISKVMETQNGPRKSTLYPYVFDPAIEVPPFDARLAQYDYWGYEGDEFSEPRRREVFGPTAEPAWQARWESASAISTVRQMVLEAGVAALPQSNLWLAV